MGRLQEHFSANALGSHDAADAPLSGGDSSPSPLLPPAPPGRKRSSRSRHVMVRLICSPFAAVFRTTCSPRARSIHDDDDDDQASGAGSDEQEGQAARRRPRLEELLKMESASSAPEELIKKPTELVVVPDVDDSWKESAIVVFGAFDDDDTSRTTGEEEEEEEEEDDQLEYTGVQEQRQMAIVPAVGLGVRQPAAGGGGAALMNVKRLVLLLEAMRARSMALKVKGSSSSSSYWRLAGRGPGPGGRAADKADQLFYDRPIPLGRRCRVQHLQESTPYQ